MINGPETLPFPKQSANSKRFQGTSIKTEYQVSHFHSGKVGIKMCPQKCSPCLQKEDTQREFVSISIRQQQLSFGHLGKVSNGL